MVPRLIHRIRVHPTPAQVQQFLQWRPHLATLQLCADLLHTAILDGRSPWLLDDPGALLDACESGACSFIDPNRSVIGPAALRLRDKDSYSQKRFEATLSGVLGLMDSQAPAPLLLPARTVRGLREAWYGSTQQPVCQVAADLPRAVTAHRITEFYFGQAVATDDRTLQLQLSAPGASELTPLLLAAEVFTLPSDVQRLAQATLTAQGRLAEVVLQLTSTGSWAWLMLSCPEMTAVPPPNREAIGIDPNVRNLLVGWDGERVPRLTQIPEARDGSLRRRRQAFLSGAAQVEVLVGELQQYALIGIEGTGRTASMRRMENALQRNFLHVVIDRLASLALSDSTRQVLQTYAPYTSSRCPRPGCGARISSGAAVLLTCPVCAATMNRDELAARNHYAQLAESHALRAWWQHLPPEFKHQLHLVRSV